jgi:Fe-S-cluster-containing dehydrogenase component
MTKCHLCHHRLDRAEPPACVAACPTAALRHGCAAGPDFADEESIDLPPGFADPAGCSPRVAFLAPRGTRRKKLMKELLERRLGVRGPGEGVDSK